MAQCEAEGRKHPSMDLYAGIFNSKLYASSRGSPRVGSVNKWSRNGPPKNVESFRGDTPAAERSSYQGRSFCDKPLVVSDLGDVNRKSAFYSNGGSARFEMKKSVAEESNERKTAVHDKRSSPQADALHVNIYKKGSVTHLDYVDSEEATAQTNVGYEVSGKISLHADVGHPSPLTDVDFGIKDKNMGYASSEKTSPYTEIAHGSHDRDGLRLEIEDDISMKNSPSINAGYGADGRLSPQARMGFGSIEKRIAQFDVSYGGNKKNNSPPERSGATNGSHIVVKNSQINVGDRFDDDLSAHSSDMKNTYRGVGFGIPENRDVELGPAHVLQKSPQVVSEGALQPTNIRSAVYVPFNSNDHVDEGNVNGMSSLECSAADGPSLPLGASLSKTKKPQDMASARRSFSSSSESTRFVNGALSSSGTITGDASSHSCASDLARYQRSGDVGEVDTSNQGNNGSLLKHSPSRGHSFVATRVGGSGSMDSSSSHGGSSHSGSPTAVEGIRESRTSSFGNILISKGSPHSVSSRSMGSASISGNGMLPGNKSSFNDIPVPLFRYGTSSGRKSAEIVPNRRSSEIFPNRKSSEMITNGRATMQGLPGDGMFSSGNVRRGSGNSSNGNNISLNNGNLLVGSANGSVQSVGGGMKLSNKQGNVVNQAHTIDSTLLKKAQASSDPEDVKNAGNEYYRRGHFDEALILYNRAVSLCPSNAAYKSNKAAALSGLGRLGEAVRECKDAIKLDSSYVRAHQRVAALYLRLGFTEWAKQHFNAAGQQTDLMEVQRMRSIDGHVSRCIEARMRCEWQNVIRESDAAVVAGADSAPQIFGYKSEALLGLHKPDEADAVCTAAQKVDRSLVKSGVVPEDPFLLIVRAQIDIALGRFEAAVEAAKSASKIDPHNDNIAALLRKAQAVCHTRATGNDLFKAGRFFEALALYAEGLESDPTNAVLLCNRAACRSKLGQWEKAMEDCNAALRVQPNYTKALMRRANCWTKLERWEDALQDYELLRRKMPEDLEVARGLFDVHVAIKKSRGEDTRKMKFGCDVQEVLTEEQFQEAISSPGLSVVQFITRWSERCRQLSPFVNDLCKRNPCVNFVKVDVEDVPYLAKIESVSFIPTFKIYKNGQKVKEMLGPTEQSLEYALKHYAL